MTAQAVASQGLTAPGVPREAQDQAAVALPLTPSPSARRPTGAAKTSSVKTPAAKTMTETAQGGVSKAVTNKAVSTKAVASKAVTGNGSATRASGSLKTAKALQTRADQARTERRRIAEQSDVLVSAVISTYLLTHLHHVLQRAEFGAQQEGRAALAANYAQLRKVLCLDARTMEDASASGQPEDAPQAA